ncbi:MAG TPA: hypothetical protein VL974_14265 [Magnetospirillum sp.]|jgi:hypothetical protein|nr:hypothetical protein [Magnetospirillum sp.]
MTLTDKHIETLKDAPFILGRFPGISHDLCRKGLLRWVDGAWHLTLEGRQVLAEALVPTAA